MILLPVNNDPFYDIFEDWDLIVSSFQTQYNIRIYSQDFKKMKWDEFKALLSGLDPKTPLGRIVAIRAENNKDVLKNFTEDQKRIRNEWYSKKFKSDNISIDDYNKQMEMFKNMFMSLAK